ncbi:HNH endonuclease [Deinococcus wulumuqiensis]
MKKLYAVWGGDGSIEPGVYEGVWMDDLGPKVDGAGAQKKRVDTRDEGYDCLDQEGFGWTRQLLRKATLLHDRCWYCARPLNPASIGDDDSTELEHQVPRSSRWPYVDREENLVAACRRCNNGRYPGKGERDVQGFRQLLQQHFGARRIVFYGEVLRWLRAASPDLHLPAPLTPIHVTEVLSWYARSEGLKLHTWREGGSLQDYETGLLLLIPPDAPPYALGAPHRLPPAPDTASHDPR